MREEKGVRRSKSLTLKHESESETAGRTHVDRALMRHNHYADSGGAVSSRNRKSLQKNSRFSWRDVGARPRIRINSDVLTEL